MTNWCRCELDISGEPYDVEQFVELGASPYQPKWSDWAHTLDTELNFHAMFLVPEAVQRAGLGGGGEKWCEENWGSKWQPEADLTVMAGSAAHYSFLSAGNPPRFWLAAVAIRYPELRFRMVYEEEDEKFSGTMKCENGVCEDRINRSSWMPPQIVHYDAEHPQGLTADDPS